MSIKLRIPGQPEAAPRAAVRGGESAATAKPVTHLLDDVEVVHAFSLSPAARARGTAEPAEVEVPDDAIVEIEVDGFQLWTSAKKYEETVRAVRPEAARLDAVTVDALPAPAGATRGEADRSASAVRVLNLRSRLEEQLKDPKILKEFAEEFGVGLADRAGSWMLAKALIWLVERQLKPREGLYHWDQAIRAAGSETPNPAPATFDDVDPAQPILLFLHGTGSSTRGSFGEFLQPGAKEQWDELTNYFGGRIYAYEHKTLSRSPIENAIAVAGGLPAGSNLHLVSHSRGGMIGDLLSLRAIDSRQIAAFTRHGEFDAADKYDRDRLTQLSDLLAKKKFKVQRFARAAAPARGTLLASENIDQFLSVITYLVGLIPFLKASPLYEIVKRITLETVKRRWEPGMLPGVEAMIPTSPLVRLLNAAKDQSPAALGVIAGDIQGGSWLKRFGTFVSDRAIYENRDNDLVVNTDSMFCGLARQGARYVFDQGADVSHFNYFKNERTRAQVSQWLTVGNIDALADFRKLEEALEQPKPMKRGAASRSATARPAVILVPDLMGSDLHTGETRIWLNFDALSDGAVAQLGDLSQRVRTESVLSEHYQTLSDALAKTHEVIPCAYDWRQSTSVASEAVTEIIRGLLDQPNRTIRIVAHGMGGLIVEQMARLKPDVWKALTTRDGARVVLLGTPHAGTYDAVELLLGTHPVAQQLAMLDPTAGPRGVIEMFQDFPGVLELLPKNVSAFATRQGWRTFAAVRHGAKEPDATLLKNARAARGTLDDGLIQLDVICNVAGTSPRTVVDVGLQDGRVVLALTTEGDGRVTHQSAGIRNVATWYADAAHGELTSDPVALAAIQNLLESGRSKQLSTTPPSASRGGERLRRTVPERVLYPTQRDLLVGAFGKAPRRTYEDKPSDAAKGFRVTVVHGDLSFARFPIVVGHYEGDTIIGAESVIDRLFDGALKTRYNLGLYPGPLGSHTVVVREPTPLQKALQLPPGAVVVGLGRWGELTAGQIANIIRRGAIEYVLQVDNQQRRGNAPDAKNVGLSVLLIGATASNLSTEDSVAAILRGIAQANLELQAFVQRARTRISEIEIIELYVDSAIEAARAAKRLAGPLSEELRIPIEASPMLQRGRYGRTRWGSARNLDAWRRWQVTMVESEKKTELPRALRTWLAAAARKSPADAALLTALAEIAVAEVEPPPSDRLRFVSLSDRARAEVTLDQHQPELIDRLIQASITDTSYKAEDARVMFELMVPNDLKDGLGQLSNVVFVLDGETSAYPWELMTDAGESPLCTRLRMVRQLQSATFRQHIRVTTSRNALIVGDPKVTPPFQQLQGAMLEADVVERKLAATKGNRNDTAERDAFQPFRVPPGATARDVFAALFARPYRIIHLAGHGDYRAATVTTRERSGMVLDNGVFLTAAEVRKMAQVPELVFLNCCWIGQTGPELVDTPYRPYNRLAASISRELIEMGVRAVVAAGWAVRDDAALVFAEKFYDEMLNGATFGRALMEARTATWRRFPDSNTWGAYQAYGDPDFRLVLDGAPPRADGRVAHEELLEQIDRIWQRARTLGVQDEYSADQDAQAKRKSEQVHQLEKLLADVPQAWLDRSDVRVAIAEAYGELREFASAIEHYEFALDTGELDSKTTLKAAEQLFNFMARKAQSDNDAKRLREAIVRLRAMQDVGQTSERFNLLGSAQKRLASIVTDPAEVRRAIADAATSYGESARRHAERGTFDHYPVVNRLALLAVLDDLPRDWQSLLNESALNARERFQRDRGTKDAAFHAIASADIAVVRALADKTLSTAGAKRTTAIDDIVGEFRGTLDAVKATPRQADSVVQQIDTLAALIKKLAGARLTGAAKLRREALLKIAEAIV